MTNTKLIQCPYTKRWHVLDGIGFTLASFIYPSDARKFKHLYHVYMTVPSDDDANALMVQIQQLMEDRG